MLIDTHCHIHEKDFPFSIEDTMARAHNAGVHRVFCVGTDERSSYLATELSEKRDDVFAIVGVHPHEAKHGCSKIEQIIKDSSSKGKVIGVGEIGLDYFYNHSSREEQIKTLEEQIDIALRHDLPIAFHVRDAFDDFWPIYNNFKGIKGELHSFTDSASNLQRALTEGLLIGVNGISTFTKDESQVEVFDSVPLSSILLETDAPFLTPAPFRGKINEPAHVRLVADWHASRRGISLDDIARATTENANKLFNIS